MTDPDFLARLNQLEDRRALDRLILDYLQRADARQWRAWLETFTPAAVFDLPNSFGLMRGQQEIYDTCVGKMEGTWAETQHMIVNTDFDIDGDHATGTANICFAGVPAGGVPADVYTMGGRYRWRFVRTGDGWKIDDAWEEFIWNNGAGPKAVFDPGG